MKILLPYAVEGIGGPFTFVRAFRQEAEAKGHTIVTSFIPSFDILFIIIACPLWLVLYAKLRGRKIVQRLDGVYHPGLPGTDGRWYWWKNVRMRLIHLFGADIVVYQSTFSRLSCERWLGTTRAKTTIIKNGVAVDTITPRSEMKPHHPLRLVASASWHRRDQIEPLLAAVQRLTIPYTLDLYGRYTSAVAHFFSLPPSSVVSYKGVIPPPEIVAVLRHYDIFLFADQSACPNIVVEALAVGLPVVAFARGGVTELVRPGANGQLVRLAVHDPWQVQYPFSEDSYERFAAAIHEVAMHLASYSEAARKTAESEFQAETMVAAYLDLCEG